MSVEEYLAKQQAKQNKKRGPGLWIVLGTVGLALIVLLVAVSGKEDEKPKRDTTSSRAGGGTADLPLMKRQELYRDFSFYRSLGNDFDRSCKLVSEVNQGISPAQARMIAQEGQRKGWAEQKP